ncbi:major capsid protein P2 [Pseudoteredinibacter isoporae]|uniref:major capsid protein P2 n=1 Tax=Pseudoteredinibacter isoporae TaxID=570281 RepID=UPI0031062A03
MKITPIMHQLKAPLGNDYDEEWNIVLEGGLVYHVIELQTSLKVAKTLRKVTIEIGGTPIAYASGELLKLKEAAYKKHGEEGRFVLDLANFEYRTPVGIYQSSLVTGADEDVILKVEFGEKDATDPAKLTMRGKAWVTENSAANTPGAGREYLPTMKTLTLDCPEKGDFEVAYQGSQTRWLQRMYIDESNVNVTKVFVKRGKTTIHEATRDDIDFAMQRYADVDLPSGHLLLDFTLMGFGVNDAMNTHGLNFVFQTDGPGAMKVHVDGYEKVA